MSSLENLLPEGGQRPARPDLRCGKYQTLLSFVCHDLILIEYRFKIECSALHVGPDAHPVVDLVSAERDGLGEYRFVLNS
jgi:hypothetical protein